MLPVRRVLNLQSLATGRLRKHFLLWRGSSGRPRAWAPGRRERQGPLGQCCPGSGLRAAGPWSRGGLLAGQGQAALSLSHDRNGTTHSPFYKSWMKGQSQRCGWCAGQQRRGRGIDDWTLGRQGPSVGEPEAGPGYPAGRAACPLPVLSAGRCHQEVREPHPPESFKSNRSRCGEAVRDRGQTDGSQHRAGPEGCFLQTSLPCDPEAGDQGATPGETPGRVCCGHPLGEEHFLQVTPCSRRCCGNTPSTPLRTPRHQATASA